MTIGALVFLGCPLRMGLRLAAGDLNALVGLVGFAAGIWVGLIYLRNGFSLGRSTRLPAPNGAAMPAMAAGTVLLAAAAPAFIFFSTSGPGASHAPLLISLAVGLLVGVLAQRSRLCMAGGIRDLFLIKSGHLFVGFVAIFAAALVLNLAVGDFKLGFEGQPVAHTDGLWNFLGMGLVGLCATLAGGCPLRQCILSGEGDADAAVTVLGMLIGAAFAHNFGTAASAAGVTANGKWAVAIGYAAAVAIAYFASAARLQEAPMPLELTGALPSGSRWWTQKALQMPAMTSLRSLDNACSLENVTRFAIQCAVEIAPLSHAEAEGEGVDGCYIIRITPRAGAR